MEYYIRILLLLSAAGSCIYGIIRLMKGNSSLVRMMATGTVFCFMLGRLYDFVTVLIRGSLPVVFNLGMISRMGAFLFLLALSSRKPASEPEGKNSVDKKPAKTAWVAPVLILCLTVPIWSSDLVSVFIKIAVTTIGLVACAAGYYSFRLFLLPEDAPEKGLKTAYLFSVLLLFFNTAQLLFEKTNAYILWYVSSFAIVALYPLFIGFMFRGSKK